MSLQEDLRTLRLLARERRNLPSREQNQKVVELSNPVLRNFIIFLDDTLPACTYNSITDEYTLGQQECTLWERQKTPGDGHSALPENAPTTLSLQPRRRLDKRCVVRRVFNTLPKEFPACVPLQAVQDSFGDLYIQDRVVDSEFQVTTSSTTTMLACGGTCKWTWDGSKWSITTDNCSNTTSTTTSSTTSAGQTTSSTTTTEDCACGSTTTSSTTTADCNCICPTFNGLSVGDCTYTSCTRGVNNGTGSTCSTDCNCATSTTSTTSSTTTAANCATGCDWKYVPQLGGWQIVSASCTVLALGQSPPTWPACGCSQPNVANPSNCQTAHTNCEHQAPVPPIVPTCSGGCFWTWFQGNWYQYVYGCHHYESCQCFEPTFAGNDCQTVVTPCVAPVDPCGHCYTTTSSTTTLSGCSDTFCLWKWGGSFWSQIQACIGLSGCNCDPPVFLGTETCQVETGRCSNTTTTTTSTTTTGPTTTSTTTTTTSTTTTTNCGGQRCWFVCLDTGGGNYQWVQSVACSGVPCDCDTGVGGTGCTAAESGHTQTTDCTTSTTTS